VKKHFVNVFRENVFCETAFRENDSVSAYRVTTMPRLDGQIALVTGASRGLGKGIALALGESGATVYVTGRTTIEGRGPENLSGTIHATAAEISALGGRGVALPCDHTDDAQTLSVFDRIAAQSGRLDILVNAVWGGYDNMMEAGEFTWTQPFWNQPSWRWDAMFAGGVRASYIASAAAARMMVAQKSGLIVNLSFWASRKHIANVAYGAAKAATDKITRDMAEELRPHNVAVVSLYPGLVRTERVMRFAEFLDMSNSESPQFSGRAIAALASDPEVLKKSGEALIAAQLALEYGFTDIDGKQPKPLALESAQ
jgi:dehydrogenase/reductase SDR family member 1